MNGIVSTISFIQDREYGELYAKYACRLADDVIDKTPFDIKIATNAPDLFSRVQKTYGNRCIIDVVDMTNNAIRVGPTFNQLLKYCAFKNVPTHYDWLLYLDCDTGIHTQWDTEQILAYLDETGSKISADSWAMGADGTVWASLLRWTANQEREERNKNLLPGEEPEPVLNDMFWIKFVNYGITQHNIPEEWKSATMPSEHMLMMKNIPEKVKVVGDVLENYNSMYVENARDFYTCATDGEAFEIGIALKVAGYTTAGLSVHGHNSILNLKFNGNQWEGIKI